MEATMTKERPILFSGPLVRALLDGRKTQTRRVVKPQPTTDGYWWTWKHVSCNGESGLRDGLPCLGPCPYGFIGDRLWVRETWADVNTESGPGFMYASDGAIRFCSDDAYPVEYERYPNCTFTMWHSDLWFRKERKCADHHHWRTSIFMPRWASRITLEITDVRVQRLQDISEEDCEAEGIDDACLVKHHVGPPRKLQFRYLWEGINGPDSWSANPWVWALTFRRIVAAANQ
jgi:hypothetical protein